jgi:DNA (cytosine-5)-methyltransferase 1
MKLKVASLFSGAGGLDLGFKLSGHKIVWANDIDPDSTDTYTLNIGREIVCGSIDEIDANRVPDFDILVGGFPCQGFSRANIHRVEKDERNSLYVNVVRILRDRQPKFFLLENVKGIISLNGGNDFNEIKLALEESGYDVQHKVLNAADYGVPQSRIRVIIIGIRNDLVGKYKYEYPNPTHSKSGEHLPKWVSIGDVLKDIPEPTEEHELKNHICSSYKVVNRDFTGHRRTDPNKPSPTILARGNGGGGVCAIPHPNNNRRLTVRESAMMQTFPMDFEFQGSLTSMYRQIGNAVPVKFAQKIAAGFKKK